jgi:hypothetical protein
VTHDVKAEVLPEPTVEELIDKHFGEHAERMKVVAKCESGLKQFVNGNVVMSPTRDFGAMQINEKTWDKTLTEMGLDYKNNTEHNIIAAKYIFSLSGERAWVCSRIV